MVGHILKKYPKAGKLLKILWHINLKTIRFNFKYFKFADAIQFPVFVKKTIFYKLKGKITIIPPLKPGMIKIGYGFVGHFDRGLKAIWEVQGEVVFGGNALIKHGSKIVVGAMGRLELGEYFRSSPNSAIICNKRVVFGHSCRLSWDVLVMDSDFHKITTLEGEQINSPREIIFGDHVWVGAKATIMKGAKIYNNCVVASNSVVTKEIEGSNQIVAGMPAKVIRTGITWEG
jgi:acetyltransferase-like isoleucine patch superfamily enzyme